MESVVFPGAEIEVKEATFLSKSSNLLRAGRLGRADCRCAKEDLSRQLRVWGESGPRRKSSG